MKIKQIEIKIDELNPFSNCKLDREQYANTLTGIVSKYQDGFVLAINNEWGTGKTTFVKMWQQQLNLRGFKTLYFNAWENDFESNPLVAVMSELRLLTKLGKEKVFKSLVEKAAILSKNILPQLIKAVANKYLDSKVLVELIENTTKGATEILENEINEYVTKKAGLNEFKISLEHFISQSRGDNPVVFIIDELDRCRPNYAVELLEQIKHLFSVSGIVFVLAIDKIQLGHAVRGVYGSDKINADEYLRRFIDVEYSIPEPKTESFCKYLFDYFEFATFFKSEKRSNVFYHEKDSLIITASILFEKSNLTLRQQEKIFAQARIGLLFFGSNHFLLPELYIILIYLKSIHRNYYNNMILRKFEPQGLLSEFENLIPKTIENNGNLSIMHVEALFVIMYNYYFRSDFNKRLIVRDNVTGNETSNIRSKFDKSEKGIDFTNALIGIYENNSISKYSIDYLFKKIDLTENLSI